MGRLRRFFYAEFMPVTKMILILSGAGFVLSFLFSLFGIDLGRLLVMNSLNWIRQPWVGITYPLYDFSLISVLFAMLWLWFVGGSLERTWGTRKYGWFAFWVTLTTGVVMAAVGYLRQTNVIIYGLWLPLTGITWAWADIYPGQEMLFFGIVPIQARWLAWIQAAITFFTFSRFDWLVGLASLIGIVIAYLFQSRGGYRSRAKRPGFSFKRWLEERRRKKQRKRLRVVH